MELNVDIMLIYRKSILYSNSLHITVGARGPFIQEKWKNGKNEPE